MTLIFIKSGLCLSILFLIYHLVFRKENMFTFNRYFLLGSLAFSLIVPLLSIPDFFPNVNHTVEIQVPSLDYNFLGNELESGYVSTSLSGQEFNTSKEKIYNVNWDKVLFTIYLLVGVLLFFRFILQIRSLGILIKKNKVVKKEGYNFVLLSKETMPFTFFNYLFVNGNSYETEGFEKEILQHEMAHIIEKHSFDILFIELLKIAFWFNPIFYLYKKAIQLNHEFLADRYVISVSRDVLQYQKILVSKVLGKEFIYKLSSPINYSVTKNRLKMMKKVTSNRKSNFLKAVLIPTLLLMFGVFSQSTAYQEKTMRFRGIVGNDFESYIKEALSDDSDFILELEKLDIEGARAAYKMLSEEEKSKLTEFPILDDNALAQLVDLQKAKDSIKVRINFSAPPDKKLIMEETWQNWLETKNLEVFLDGKEIDKSELDNFSPQDIALYEVRGIEKKKFLKPEKFKLTLTTHSHYENKYVLARKRIETIKAQYSNGDIAEIPYFMKYVLMNQKGKIEEYFPENYLERALQAILTHEFKDSPSANAIMDIRKSFWINVTRNGQKEMVVVSYH
jgi:bla regulator protein blaR1